MWLMDSSTLEWQWFKLIFNVHICTKIFLYQELSKLGLKIYDCVYKLSAEKLMLLNCGVGKDSWESLGQQGDPTSPS